MLTAPRLLKHRSNTVEGTAKGHPAPEFVLKDIAGKTVKLSDYKGKAVVLNFWATWCPPCKTEIPWFEDLANKYRAQGLEVIGVAMDDSSEKDIASFAREMKMNYPVLLGKEETSDAYGGVDMLPTTFYIDRSGMITDHVLGLVSRKEIEDNALKAMNSKSEGPTREASAPHPTKETSR
jgi:cytochrome c biogenesis protein CcmG/thiol:disulfide interchange protein DsbE